MKKIIGIFFLIIAAWMRCGATQYYVSSSAGNDSTGNGTQASPWKTFGGAGNHVNAGSFSPGDIIYLKRGDIWNEPLIPPSAGSSGNPITFDAYGTGPAPVITASSAIPFVGASWTYVSGSTWKATIVSTVSSGTVNFVQFGNLYGRKQPYGSGCASSIVNKYDWCLVWPSLYVYSASGTNPVSTYSTDGSIVPIVAQVSGLAMISVVSKSWLVFQHIKVQTFDYTGVSVTGNSDNLVFGNMEVDGMVPASGTPLGFYVNVASGYGTSIQFLNDNADLNYDGFKVDAAGAVTVKNCRGYGRAVAEVLNRASVAGLQNGGDDGRRGLVRVMKTPGARTQTDCENAALALLDVGPAWSGSYETWSDFLPGGAFDIFPGDAVAVNVPSRTAVFGAIVRRVVIDVRDPANDRGMYMIEFANDAASSLSFQDESGATSIPLQDLPVRLAMEQVGSYFLQSLTNAQVTETTSTTVTVDAGMAPGSGFGIEVRAHDYGWGMANDRNLLGRFSGQSFALPRLGRTQNYFLRLYDSSSPPRYSRYAAALHVDKPL